MSTKKGLVSGKVKDSHSTYIEEATWMVEAAKKIASVKSVNPGRIDGKGGSVIRTLRVISQNGGLLLIVKGSNAKQGLHVYVESGTDILAIVRQLQEVWEKKVPDEKKRRFIAPVAA